MYLVLAKDAGLLALETEYHLLFIHRINRAWVVVMQSFQAVLPAPTPNTHTFQS